MNGNLSMNGTLKMTVRKKPLPISPFWWQVRQRLFYRWRELPMLCFLVCLPILRRIIPGLNVWHGAVYLKARIGGRWVDLGIAGRHLVVTAGKNYVAASFNAGSATNLMKYHGFGTGTTAAAAGDTLLQTELTTQYAVASTRPTGSQANLNNTYTTVGTVVPGSGGTIAVTEWGLFSASASGATTLFDHQVFSAVNLNSANGDSLAATYVLTLS